MDPSLQPPAATPSLTTAPTTTTVNTPTYPDSIDSSPRSRNNDSLDDPPPSSAGAAIAAKLRLMCSYGGHIVPRPHDKSLCYVGGDTRIVVADRQTNLASLSSRLSHTLLNDRPFTLKYQLPSEDLDSLISVTTDEDLENMIDEYDRNTSSNSKPSRLRLFLFPLKPESSQSIGPLLENPAKSEDWFLNALNGAGMLNRGFSESASVNCLLGLDDDSANGNGNNLVRDTEGSQKNMKQGQDIHSVPDSPMLETTSSFGSTSSSPSLANLPPIRVHAEDRGGVKLEHGQKVAGIEEQFVQMGFGVGTKQDEGFAVPPPPMPGNIVLSGLQVNSEVVSGEYSTRVVSDDERSDHGLSAGYRKPPTPLAQQQQQQQQQQQLVLPQQSQKSTGALDLASPDSVSSDSSLTNAMARPKPAIFQDQVVQAPSGAGLNRFTANPVDPKINIAEQNARVLLHQQQQQQVHDSGYFLQPQFEPQHPQQPQQQQYVHAGAHFITQQHQAPMSAYYQPVYSTQPQHPQHHQLDHQQYPVYYMQARPPQAYNFPIPQPSINDNSGTISQTPPASSMVGPTSVGYNPVRTANSQMQMQMPAGQQYVGYSQIHQPSQSVAPNSTATGNYMYEFTDPAHGQVYYNQPPFQPPLTSQYQTMTAAAAVASPEVSAQVMPAEAIKQQIRSSQAQQ